MRTTLYRSLVFACLCLSSVLAKADTAELFEASISNPERDFGYTLGDVLQQTILVQRGDNTLTLSSLPLIQREGRWLTRSHAALSPDGTVLTLHYQLINAPLDVRRIALPELLLPTAENVSIAVPAWSFTIAPLIPGSAEEEAEVPLMQGDWLPKAPSTEAVRKNLKALAIALALSLLSWMLWLLWRNWREKHTLPFAKAHNTLRATKSASAQNDASNWLALHEAFNRCAGRSVAGGSVPAMLSDVTWLKPMETDIQTFFKLSSTRFFSSEQSQQTFDLQQFAKRLYKAEKDNTSKHTSPALKDLSSS